MADSAAQLKFRKYHGLGNDYIVVDARAFALPSPEEIRRICDRHRGPGSDGILWGPFPAPGADFGLRIFNPDGSEAEKSGNGLRIFSRFLYDEGLVGGAPFTILTPGGRVTSEVLDGGRRVRVEMGRVSFFSSDIPAAGPPREVLREPLEVGGEVVTICAASIGNPHCVVLCDAVSSELAHRLGPLIERHPLFPRRTNVQFMQVLGPDAIRIEIWERGAGYTLASGSSSSAAAAVAHRLGLCGNEVTVHMPGGTLDIRIAEGFAITMTGPVVRVYDGEVSSELFEC